MKIAAEFPCLTGKSKKPVQPPLKKYSGFPKTQISLSPSPSRPDQRGARAIVTNAGRDAVDAAASGMTRDGRAGFGL
jgi:hypothetical protein